MKNGNKILIYKQDGSVKEVSFVWGLNIQFFGKNSTVEIYEPFKFRFQIGAVRSNINILGDNNSIIINSSTRRYKSLRLRSIGNNTKVVLGNNLILPSGFEVDFAYTSGLELNIGEDCMFGQEVKLMLGDYHTIYSLEDNKVLNAPKKGINIGKNVWIARNATIMKDVEIGDNSIVAYGSIVTKSFPQNNVLIAGIPAKIVKENVTWNIKNTDKFDFQQL